MPEGIAGYSRSSKSKFQLEEMPVPSFRGRDLPSVKFASGKIYLRNKLWSKHCSTDLLKNVLIEALG